MAAFAGVGINMVMSRSLLSVVVVLLIGTATPVAKAITKEEFEKEFQRLTSVAALNECKSGLQQLDGQLVYMDCEVNAILCRTQAACDVLLKNTQRMAECVLDEMPGVANNSAASQTMEACRKKWPGDFRYRPAPAGPSLFGYSSAAECASKKGRETSSERAGRYITNACRILYGP